jgi:molybdenum cofactor cytidylyltransferase
MIFAVVPAAGKSTRMGKSKLALRIGGRSVLERVVDALRSGGVDRVVVVLGPSGVKLAALAEGAGAEVLVQVEQTAHMRNTVEAGLDHLRQHCHPAESDAWVLAPADHPMLSPDVTASLIETAANDPAHSIFIPTYCGRRGHPVLFRWTHAVAIQDLAAKDGLHAYVRACTKEVRDVPVTTEHILLDMDTPEDYRRLLEM